jgi:hypothetical protein
MAFRMGDVIGRSLCVIDGSGLGVLLGADLICGKSTSADAATPACGRNCEGPRRILVIGKPGSDQFAAAFWTESLNHRRSCTVKLIVIVAETQCPLA